MKKEKAKRKTNFNNLFTLKNFIFLIIFLLLINFFTKSEEN